MAVARSVVKNIESSSLIRKMFETGTALKKSHGDENVFDFSLGNPVLEPPKEVQDAFVDLAFNPPAGLHRYMCNRGHSTTRAVVAASMSEIEGVEVDKQDVVMTVGAAGALNVATRSIVEPGDEGIILCPYFVDYHGILENHGAVPRVVETRPNFQIDLQAVEASISEKTRLIMINTPNNPTGAIYDQASINELGSILRQAERRFGKPIYVLADTPYARITYDRSVNPTLFSAHDHTLIAHSYSKDLGLAGERIGCIVVNPRSPARKEMGAAFSYCNRILGYVNAPSTAQRVIERAISASVDIGYYAAVRRLLCSGLRDIGYDFIDPQGAFYVFSRTPVDDLEFARLLQDQKIIVVPGRAFGRKNHIRISFCITTETVKRALPIFKSVFEQASA